MLVKVLSSALVAGMLFSVAAPIAAHAADAPKTKAECLKVKGMHWDEKTNACVKG